MQVAASHEAILSTCDIKVSIKVLKDSEIDENGRFCLEDIAINVILFFSNMKLSFFIRTDSKQDDSRGDFKRHKTEVSFIT